MKKQQREPYRILTTVPLLSGFGCCICSFCRYAEWTGGCKEPECFCTHPLDCIYDFDTGEYGQAIWGDGEDCWGFRPKVSREVACEMVSNWLNGKDVVLEPEHLLSSHKAKRGG